jgi:hypothetical protein
MSMAKFELVKLVDAARKGDHEAFATLLFSRINEASRRYRYATAVDRAARTEAASLPIFFLVSTESVASL